MNKEYKQEIHKRKKKSTNVQEVNGKMFILNQEMQIEARNAGFLSIQLAEV